jgi:hypothetical protein
MHSFIVATLVYELQASRLRLSIESHSETRNELEGSVTTYTSHALLLYRMESDIGYSRLFRCSNMMPIRFPRIPAPPP